MRKHIFHAMVDEGASTCIMSVSFWKVIDSSKLNTSTTLLKSCNGHMFQPHEINITLPINLGGNIVFVSMEVVNTPLEYNLFT